MKRADVIRKLEEAGSALRRHDTRCQRDAARNRKSWRVCGTRGRDDTLGLQDGVVLAGQETGHCVPVPFFVQYATGDSGGYLV